jgi:hypothetical protein
MASAFIVINQVPEEMCDARSLSFALVDKSRDSAVGIATGYGQDDRGFGVPSPGRGETFSLLYLVQTDSGAHPASSPIGTGDTAAGA